MSYCNQNCGCNCCNPCLCCVGPTGPTGPTGPAGTTPVIAFGGRYNDVGGTLTLPAATEITLSLPTVTETYNMNTAANSLVVTQPGIYQIIATLYGVSANGTFTADFYASVNAVAQAPLDTTINFGTTHSTGILDNYVELEQGDVVTLNLFSTAGGSLTLGNGVCISLTLLKVGFPT